MAVGFKFRAFGASLGGLLVWRGVRTVPPASTETSSSAAEHRNFDISKEFDGSADNLTRGRGPTGWCREVRGGIRRGSNWKVEYRVEMSTDISRKRRRNFWMLWWCGEAYPEHGCGDVEEAIFEHKA